MADGPWANAGASPRVLFLGMTGAFSLPVLEVLVSAGVPQCGLLIPAGGELGKETLQPAIARRRPPAGEGAEQRGLPILTPQVRRNVVHLAWQHGLPVFEVNDLGVNETLAVARQLRPDAIVVACWPRLIPRVFREIAKLAVNVHPSLLPENRGPAPLFWTFRLGQRRTGVTVHLLDDKADAGAILAQRGLAVPDGIDGAELEMQLARSGGELLVQVVRDFAAGKLNPRPQDESRATYHPWPSEEEWLIPADWPPRRASNFVRGVSHMRVPLRVGLD